VTSIEKTVEHDVYTAGVIRLHMARVGDVVLSAFTLNFVLGALYFAPVVNMNAPFQQASSRSTNKAQSSKHQAHP